MPRLNFHDHAPYYKRGSSSLPYPTTHQDQRRNQAVSTQVERRGMSSSLLVEERFTVLRAPPRLPDPWTLNVPGMLSCAPCDHPPVQQTFAGGRPAGLYQSTDNLRAPHESSPPSGSAACIDHSSYISRRARSPSYHPPRPHAYSTPPVSSPASRGYCPSPDIIERSEPVQHSQSGSYPCRWDTDNASCLPFVTGSRPGVENHLRAYHRVRDDVRTVICLWEGCTRTQPLRRENLARHVMTHMNIKWECPECKKLFSRPDAVQRHRDRVCPRRGCDTS